MAIQTMFSQPRTLGLSTSARATSSRARVVPVSCRGPPPSDGGRRQNAGGHRRPAPPGAIAVSPPAPADRENRSFGRVHVPHRRPQEPKLAGCEIPITSSPAVQAVHKTCNRVFKGAAEGLQQRKEDVEAVRLAVDELTLEDFGLTIEEVLRVQKENPTDFFYYDVFSCRDSALGFFVLPAGASIPLHNHPGMTVLSKVLIGDLHLRAFDWNEPPAPGTSKCRGEAHLVMDSVLSGPSDTVALFPSEGGNIHSFTAMSPCVVVDVMSPPSTTAHPTEGRACEFFEEHLEADRHVDGVDLLNIQSISAGLAANIVSEAESVEDLPELPEGEGEKEWLMGQSCEDGEKLCELLEVGLPEDDVIMLSGCERKPGPYTVHRRMYREGQRVGM